MGVIVLIIVGVVILSVGSAFLKKASNGEGGAFSIYLLFIILAAMIAIVGFITGFIAPKLPSYFYSGALYLLVFTGIIFCLHIMLLVFKAILGQSQR